MSLEQFFKYVLGEKKKPITQTALLLRKHPLAQAGKGIHLSNS